MHTKKRQWFRDVPIYLSILTLFLIILFAFAIVLIGYNFYQSRNAALQVADNLLEEVSGKVIEHLDHLYEPIFSFVDLTSQLPETKQLPSIAGHPLTGYLMEFMERYPFVNSAYIGLENGAFYQIVRVGEGSGPMKTALKAPALSTWVVQIIIHRPDGNRVRIWKYLDESRQIVDSKVTLNVDYNPVKRSWYELAQKSGNVISTPPYVYASSGEIGITIARRFDSKIQGVFGADLSNRSLSLFLKKQKLSNETVLLIYNNKSEILAYPEIGDLKRIQTSHSSKPGLTTIQELNQPFLNHLHSELQNFAMSNNSSFRFSFGNKYFIGRLWKVLEKYSKDSYFVIAEPEVNFIGHVLSTGIRNTAVSVIVLFITIPIVVLVSLRVSSPIKLLTNEAHEIQQLNLQQPIYLNSRIYEINRLQEAMNTMKSGLAAFMKYVPSSLVQQLITSGVEPELGGERRQLTLLFTDIQDFTTISESQNPEDLMKYISMYFQKMGNEILETKGTIDKYIGDAIMAFWNAPQPMENHATLACAAALNCRSISNQLNKLLKKSGCPPFYTRFGIHTGDAIVGNIGTSDRMNYTTIGSPVNLASRLEGLNKLFGTQILVSGETKKQVEDNFLFKSVGKIVVKGKTMPNQIYELCGVLPNSNIQIKDKPVSRKLLQYVEFWEKAYFLFMQKDWKNALKAFSKLKEIRPNDQLTAYYHLQSLRNKNYPPSDHWDAAIKSYVK